MHQMKTALSCCPFITLSRRVGDNLINCMGFSIDFMGFMCCVVVSLENVTESKEVFPCLSY